MYNSRTIIILITFAIMMILYVLLLIVLPKKYYRGHCHVSLRTALILHESGFMRNTQINLRVILLRIFRFLIYIYDQVHDLQQHFNLLQKLRDTFFLKVHLVYTFHLELCYIRCREKGDKKDLVSSSEFELACTLAILFRKPRYQMRFILVFLP
jgi:hypothetical protein